MNAATPLYETARHLQDSRRKIRMWPSRELVNPWDIRVEDIRLADIAHHLSNVNRFTGGTPWPYSVAQHSLLVASKIAMVDPLMRLAGLMHDASEAYLNDPASPVKRNPGMAELVEAHERAQTIIFRAFDLPIEYMSAIKWADDEAFREEQDTWNGVRVFPAAVVPWQPAAVAFFFDQEFRRLWAQLGRPDRLA